MKDRTTNHLNMVSACFAIADRPAYTLVWSGQPPVDFGTDLAALRADYAAVTAAATLAAAATTGSADAKAVAETALENAAHVLARACAAHFRKTGDATRLAQVNLTKTDIVRLRDQALVTTATLIRDLANAARNETGAVNRGVNQGRISVLGSAITVFSGLLNAPRAQIANRAALLRDVETRVADLLVKLEALDDLVMQYDGTESGRNFIAAWKQARIIVDGGHGPGGDPAPPAPTPTQ